MAPRSDISDDLQARALAEQAVRSLAEQTAEMAADKAAEKVAAKVVESLFLHFGVDVKDQRAVAAFREQLAFLARMERGAREVKSAIIKTCVGALVLGFITLLLIGVKSWFFKS